MTEQHMTDEYRDPYFTSPTYAEVYAMMLEQFERANHFYDAFNDSVTGVERLIASRNRWRAIALSFVITWVSGGGILLLDWFL